MDVPNVVKLGDFGSFEEFITVVAQAVLQYGYARVWSVRHPNVVYLAVHAPLSKEAESMLRDEFKRISDFFKGGEITE